VGVTNEKAESPIFDDGGDINVNGDAVAVRSDGVVVDIGIIEVVEEEEGVGGGGGGGSD
jgi:hypothetical protein